MTAPRTEIRKIQVTGGSTHVVSLPKGWIDRNQLGRSDMVAIHEEADGSLLLVPHHMARPRVRTITVHLPDPGRSQDVVRRLVGAYLAGADEIIVRAKMDRNIRDTIHAITRELVGVEVLEETADGMTLQDLVGVSQMDLRKTLSRMHRIGRTMFDDALRALENRDAELAAAVQARDDEVDRLLWMVSKQMHALLEQPRLAARLDVAPAGALNYYLVARTLERMADHATKISTNIDGLPAVPATLGKSIQEMAQLVNDVWDQAFQSLKMGNFDRASAISDKGREAASWREEFAQRLRQLDPALVGRLTLVADSIDRLRGYAIDIAETAMNHTFLAEGMKK